MRWMKDIYRWQVVQERFFVQNTLESCRNAEFSAMKSISVYYVDGWRIYYDSVTDASLHSKLCEEAVQLEIKCTEP